MLVPDQIAPGDAEAGVHTLIATGNPVLISFAETVLREAGIAVFVADQHMSITEGSIGAFPRRMMVASDDAERARRVLSEAGLAQELADQRTPRWGGAAS